MASVAIAYLQERKGAVTFQAKPIGEGVSVWAFLKKCFLFNLKYCMGKYTKHFSLRLEDLHNSASMEREEMLVQHFVMAVSFVFICTVES